MGTREEAGGAETAEPSSSQFNRLFGSARGLVEPSGDRTADLYNAIVALSQLSYGPTAGRRLSHVGMGVKPGAEPGLGPRVHGAKPRRRVFSVTVWGRKKCRR